MTDDYGSLTSKVLSTLVISARSSPIDIIASVGLIASAIGLVIGLLSFRSAIIIWITSVVVMKFSGQSISIHETGRVRETVDHELDETCQYCRSELARTIGYTVYLVAGYEVLRFDDFEVIDCSECEEYDNAQERQLAESAL